MSAFAVVRKHMVDNQLRPFDVTDTRLLDVIENLPREKFLPTQMRAQAYSDVSVRLLGEGETARFILPAMMTARMVQLLEARPNDIALVVACGSGYSSAVLGGICATVLGVDEEETLVAQAQKNVHEVGVENVVILAGQNTLGWEKEKPFDVILIDGALEEIPQGLIDQLGDGGRMVYIEGEGMSASARLLVKNGDIFSSRFGFNCAGHILPGFRRKRKFAL